tara:strand:- start:24163 stop:25023 length:861 start_codon:yes stop_codon:yes gene_type:complete
MFSLLCCVACFVALTSPEAAAQRRFDQSKELGLAWGTGYYLGDLNPGKHLGGRLNAGVGAYYRHNLTGRISVRANFFRGVVEAWDADSSDPWQQNRNLHFRNEISELSALVEVNYLEHRMGNPGDRFTAFLFTGIAAYNHMPEAFIEGNWIPLQPLGTEGQGTTWGVSRGLEPYATGGVSIPFGFGFKANIGPFMALCFDWGVRKTWTDYLDDVSGTYADAMVLQQESGELAMQLADQSLLQLGGDTNQAGMQRGDPGRSDTYGFLSASISFRISKKPTTCWVQPS